MRAHRRAGAGAEPYTPGKVKACEGGHGRALYPTRESVGSTPHRQQLASGGVADSFEAFKDEVEPEFELVRVVVAGLQNVLHG